jgi:superoxide reductase
MKHEPKFFICKECGNIVEKVHDAGIAIVCCDLEMEELKANTVDAANEKHVPVVLTEGNNVSVKVGEVAHPMLEKHFIQWICLHTTEGLQRKHLTPGMEPIAQFALIEGEKVLHAYEYCNLHGLWKIAL